jgi:hypothetical protein
MYLKLGRLAESKRTDDEDNRPSASELDSSTRSSALRIHQMHAIHATRALQATSRASSPHVRRRAVTNARAHFRHVTARASGDDDDDASTEDSEMRRSGGASMSSRAGLDGGKYGMGERIDRALDATTNQLSFVVGGFVLTLSAVALFAFGPRPPTEY